MSSEHVKNLLLSEDGLHDLSEGDEEDPMASSCSGDHSTYAPDTGGEPDEAKEMRETVIKKEEKAVNRSRVLVGIAVTLCAVAVTVAVYFISKQSDQTSFEIEYEGIVKDVKSLVRWETRYNFALMEQLSSSITIAAGYLNSTFPYHTEPKYEISGGFVDGMGGIMSAAFAPFVVEEQRDEWGVYTRKNQGWIEESAYLKKVHPVHRDALHGTIQDHEHDRRLQERALEGSQTVSRSIYRWENGMKVPEIHQPGHLFAPLWQVSPADYGVVNVNLLSDPRIGELYEAMLKAKMGVLSSNFQVGDMFDFLFDPEEKEFKKDPHGFMLTPVYGKITEKDNSTLVGILIAITPFGNLLDRLLPEGKDGVIGVLRDDCGNEMSFDLSDGKTKFMGYGDMHEPEFDSYENIEENIEMYPERIEGVCTHDLYLYPSTKLRSTYQTSLPIVYTGLVAFSFLVVIGLFVLYDWTITRRQNKTIATALKTQAIVTSLFPEEMGKRMIEEAQGQNQGSGTQKNQQFKGSPMSSNFKGADNNREALAKLYPKATVMFADLVGFTAWSSMRDPPAVFKLLETVYAAFDKLANKRRVFKVETIGDCYVAATGLPQERTNHHVIMARFAQDCVNALGPILVGLELELGPDTSDLGIRVGLNSGPVTAGVLRGAKARFQLFGDTVNTAARMESTGSRNRIHITKYTAGLLTASGKGNWVKSRDEIVEAKGKGVLETYWLDANHDAATHSTVSGGETSSLATAEREKGVTDNVRHAPSASAIPTTVKSTGVQNKSKRLVDWNSDILFRLLREIAIQRDSVGTVPDAPAQVAFAEKYIQKPGTMVFDELVDIIALPECDSASAERGERESCPPKVEQIVIDQLHDYVSCIAGLYRDNSFHSFDHASHVTMSVSKLLKRITARNDDADRSSTSNDTKYGISSDPLTQFAIVLSALIHDVDHAGVPNAALIGSPLADLYKNKSVAEQNSVDLAWELLMQDSYRDLRRAIYCNKNELQRFRQIVVAAVMATDIADNELKERRNARWKKAFDSTGPTPAPTEAKKHVDRKATIVIEHIIQASDVAHTMQHWHVFRKWNERLFFEMHESYKAGHSDVDPSTFWYQGEIGFFDFYIIPLAKKLKECGVFGVSSDEYLNYALQNRAEWEIKGEDVVRSYLAKASSSD